MQTKNLIQTSANVLKITSLSIGDVVKQVDTGYSSNDVYFGVVTDLMNDGEKTFIQLLRYKQSYGEIGADIKVYKGGEDLNIFPATVEEVKEHLNDAIEKLKEKVQEEERKLADKKIALKNAIDFVSMETSKNLTMTSYKEITQADYNQKKIESVF